jgi:hypothetical protein
MLAHDLSGPRHVQFQQAMDAMPPSRQATRIDYDMPCCWKWDHLVSVTLTGHRKCLLLFLTRYCRVGSAALAVAANQSDVDAEQDAQPTQRV